MPHIHWKEETVASIRSWPVVRTLPPPSDEDHVARACLNYCEMSNSFRRGQNAESRNLGILSNG